MATIVKRAVKGAPLTHDEVDANFDNLNTELATKIGGNGGTVNDDKIINFGDSNDLQIYHNATASDAYILNNTGELYIRGDNITLGSVDPTSPTLSQWMKMALLSYILITVKKWKLLLTVLTSLVR